MQATEIKCVQCGKSVEVCGFCEEPECRHVICRQCLDLALGQAKPVTYTVPESP
jgi:hypothetical protein